MQDIGLHADHRNSFLNRSGFPVIVHLPELRAVFPEPSVSTLQSNEWYIYCLLFPLTGGIATGRVEIKRRRCHSSASAAIGLSLSDINTLRSKNQSIEISAIMCKQEQTLNGASTQPRASRYL